VTIEHPRAGRRRVEPDDGDAHEVVAAAGLLKQRGGARVDGDGRSAPRRTVQSETSRHREPLDELPPGLMVRCRDVVLADGVG
jgi:hypothetical protein